MVLPALAGCQGGPGWLGTGRALDMAYWQTAGGWAALPGSSASGGPLASGNMCLLSCPAEACGFPGQPHPLGVEGSATPRGCPAWDAAQVHKHTRGSCLGSSWSHLPQQGTTARTRNPVGLLLGGRGKSKGSPGGTERSHGPQVSDREDSCHSGGINNPIYYFY